MPDFRAHDCANDGRRDNEQQPQPRSVRRLLVNLTDEFIEKDFGRRVLAESGDYGAPSYDPRPEVPNP